jgi:transaldolase
MERLSRLGVKIFADGADFEGILALYKNPLIRGFTTNPSLMRKAGVEHYEDFARRLLAAVPDRPVSLEVFADESREMVRQAEAIASWGENVVVKIPVMNTGRVFSGPVIQELSEAGVAINVTGVMTLEQVRRITHALSSGTPAIVSVFAGRIADTGVDPVPLMAEAVRVLSERPRAELLWASPRELLNIFQADAVGCQIITVTHDLVAKLALVGKDLEQYSLETVEMFYRDAKAAGYSIDVRQTRRVTELDQRAIS